MDDEFSKFLENIKKIEKTIKFEMTKRNECLEKNKQTSLVHLKSFELK